ncbi:MAG: prepilin-type N-terminal cleavage/methylation domain-containing protein [Armatimonadota bacterium]
MNRVRRAFSLIEILVVIAIIAVLASLLYVGFGSRTLPVSPQDPSEAGRADGHGTTAVGGAVARAKDEQCQQQITQLRQMVDMQTMSGDSPPASLDDVGSQPATFHRCPIGGESYAYDPSSGRVTCPHPGHEGF